MSWHPTRYEYIPIKKAIKDYVSYLEEYNPDP